MKKLILLGIALSITVMSQALTVVSTAGSLATAISNAGGTSSTIADLTVTGTIDVRDFKLMRDNMPLLTNVNLSGVTIAAYTGTGGTEAATSKVYPANTIPQYAFLVPTSYICKTSLISFVFPTSITSIGEYAFAGCSGLTTLTIPTSVSKFGTNSFCACTSLNSVNIPSSVTTIQDGAFYGCSSLVSITIPPSVTSIGCSVFDDCVSLTTVNYNATNCVHDGGIFFNCTSLTTINIGSNVTSISDGVFSSIPSLSSITIPPSVTSIGESAFAGCPLSTIYFNATNCTYMGTENYPVFQSLTPCDVIIGNSVSNIPAQAFCLFEGLKSVSISNSVTSIGTGAFNTCIGLSSIVIPSSVTSIGNSAFLKCSGLTSITIPPSVNSIGSCAFYFCTGLSSIVISSSVTSIENLAFGECRSLTTLTIPSSVTSIGNSAFYNCTGLNTLTIPSSVTSIKSSAFSNCTGLTSIFVYAPTPVDIYTFSTNVFNGVNTTTCILHVPLGSKTNYANTMVWMDFNYNNHIVEDLPNALGNTSIIKFKIITQNGQAILTDIPLGETITIYNLQGIPIYNQQATSETVTVNLPAHGVYVVKVGGESVKVIN